MVEGSLSLDPGTCVVFEGLDTTGKSTQVRLLEQVLRADSAVVAHMPSGLSVFTQRVYEALEDEDHGPSSDLARQLAHLACHAESMGHLARTLSSHALVLDRCWWSTLAYGWHGGSVSETGVDEATIMALVEAIWSPVRISVVFAFLEPLGFDVRNSDRVAEAYRSLVARTPELAVLVPRVEERATHTFIVDTLVERGLARRG
jgi:dTMP kinase